MIISHKHKFIFIKSKKTAGTSIEIALSKYCGKNDIITNMPHDPESESMRSKLGYRGPQNYRWPKNLNSLAWASFIYFYLSGVRSQIFYEHSPASEVRRYVGEKIWNSYFKFSFERNPYDKVISYYYYWSSRPENKSNTVSISEFIRSRSVLGGNFEIYGKGNEIWVDHLGLYENLNDELKYISGRLGIDVELDNIDCKTNIRKNKQHYRDILNEDDRKKIALVHAREIAHIGYSF